jgi:pyridoxamine 5'-phosphate oxidase family protein
LTSERDQIMTMFTEAELSYLRRKRRLARIATVGAGGTPHVTPVGWFLADQGTVIEVGGIDPAATKKFRDIARTHRAAIVIDDVLPPWQPRGIEVRGRAEAIAEPQPVIRIHPERILSWGIESEMPDRRHARSVR